MFDDQAQVPDTFAPDGEPLVAGRPRARKHVLRIPLDRRRQRLLRELADEVDVRPEQLAAIWLRDHLDTLAGASTLARPAGRPLAGDGEGGRGKRRRPAGRRESLHGEIMAVLAQGGPMTATEIASAIRTRGRYQAPRSSNPISGAAVSRRIANPYYRSLFERRGRQVRLATDANS